MKKLLIGLAITSIAISGCGKNDKISKADLEGNWKVTDTYQENGKYTYNGAPYGTFTMSSSNHMGTFNISNSNSYTLVAKYDYVIKTTMNGFTTNTPGSVDRTMTGTYTYNESAKTLTIVDGSETFEYNVSELTNNKMVLKQHISLTQNGMTSESDATIVCSK